MSDLRGYELTHKKILDSGKLNFLSYGFERANLRKICKDAGVTTGAFYRHFEDKNELFNALVDPLVSMIVSNFQNYETFSIQNIETNQKENVAKVHVDGTIETALFLFRNKEIYNLLINCSYGTKYADFLEQLTNMESNTRIRIQKFSSEKSEVFNEISDKGFHIINHAHFLALTEVVLHSDNEQELIENARLVSEFFSAGWKSIRGY